MHGYDVINSITDSLAVGKTVSFTAAQGHTVVTVHLVVCRAARGVDFGLWWGELPFARLHHSFETKLLSDQFTEAVFDFRVTGNWRFPSVLGIYIYVVLFAMTFQVAPCLCQFSDQSAPFHNSTPTSFV